MIAPQGHGQTALHFCFSYNHEDMANDLIERGADDELLNAEGLTCWEGLKRIDLDDDY